MERHVHAVVHQKGSECVLEQLLPALRRAVRVLRQKSEHGIQQLVFPGRFQAAHVIQKNRGHFVELLRRKIQIIFAVIEQSGEFFRQLLARADVQARQVVYQQCDVVAHTAKVVGGGNVPPDKRDDLFLECKEVPVQVFDRLLFGQLLRHLLQLAAVRLRDLFADLDQPADHRAGGVCGAGVGVKGLQELRRFLF